MCIRDRVNAGRGALEPCRKSKPDRSGPGATCGAARVDGGRCEADYQTGGGGSTGLGEMCLRDSISAFAHPREVMRRILASHRIPYPVLGWYVLRHVQHVIGASFDDIAPLRSIALLQCPVLLVHGTDDELVPMEDARRLLAAGRAGVVSLIEIAGKHDPGDALQALSLIHI